MTRVVGVLGGSGGVGASTFAAALTAVRGPSLLVDLDVASGGIDVLLGVEDAPGARWSGLRLAGGRLDPADLLDGLPQWDGVPLVAADVSSLDPSAVRQVLDVATAADLDTVVVDLPRSRCAERAAALLRCDLVVVIVRSDAAGLVGAHAAIKDLPELPLGVIVRRGELGPAEAADLVGAPLLGVLPASGGRVVRTDRTRLPRAHARVAEGVLAGLCESVPA